VKSEGGNGGESWQWRNHGVMSAIGESNIETLRARSEQPRLTIP
jgi:hypothetical protein